MREFINNFLEPVSPILPLVLLFINFKKVRASFELLLLFLVYSVLFIFNLSASVYAYYDTENIWLYDLLCIFSFVTISLYIISLLKRTTNKKVVYYFLPVYITFFLCYTYLFGFNALFNSISFAILSLLISTYCIFYFIEKITIPEEEEKLYKSYSFWVVTSFFVYYLGSFFIFLTYKHLSSRGIAVGKLWGLHNIIYFLSCCIAAFGLWKAFRTRSTW